jgi:hypothetical protein
VANLLPETSHALGVLGPARPLLLINMSESEADMRLQQWRQWRSRQEGKLGYILLWALGVPIPVLFVIFLLRGCT